MGSPAVAAGGSRCTSCSTTQGELFVQELKSCYVHMGMEKQAGVRMCHISAFIVTSELQKYVIVGFLPTAAAVLKAQI